MEQTDAEIMVLAREEPRKIVVLFDRHGPAIHTYFARRVGRTVADDLLAEVWIQAIRSRHRYDPKWASARPWLYGVAHNVLRAHWRTRRDVAMPPAGWDDPWPMVDETLDAARIAPLVRSALLQLPERDREVLLLIAWEGLTPNEVALALGVPPGTVRWRLHRSRSAMRRALAAHPSITTFSTAVEA